MSKYLLYGALVLGLSLYFAVTFIALDDIPYLSPIALAILALIAFIELRFVMPEYWRMLFTHKDRDVEDGDKEKK